MPDVTYKITKKIAVLSEEKGGWKTELNKVSWNGKEPKFDIRRWNEDHTKMGKGLTLTKEEAKALQAALKEEIK